MAANKDNPQAAYKPTVEHDGVSDVRTLIRQLSRECIRSIQSCSQTWPKHPRKAAGAASRDTRDVPDSRQPSLEPITFSGHIPCMQRLQTVQRLFKSFRFPPTDRQSRPRANQNNPNALLTGQIARFNHNDSGHAAPVHKSLISVEPD